MRRLIATLAIPVVVLSFGYGAARRAETGQGEPGPRWSPVAVDSPAIAALDLPEDPPPEVEQWRSVEHFPRLVAQFKTVFWDPRDTESLRRLIRTSPDVRGKAVLEIGTGTGLLFLCCLKAGAASALATDVNPAAIANAKYNAGILAVADRLETRLSPLDRPEAYSTIGESERFDLIISNPPWENQTPGPINEFALYDPEFALMRSILSGLRKHLKPGGKALLAYGCVEAVLTLQRMAAEYNLAIRTLDDRSLQGLPEVFLPGMLFEVVPVEDKHP